MSKVIKDHKEKGFLGQRYCSISSWTIHIKGEVLWNDTFIMLLEVARFFITIVYFRYYYNPFVGLCLKYTFLSCLQFTAYNCTIKRDLTLFSVTTVTSSSSWKSFPPMLQHARQHIFHVTFSDGLLRLPHTSTGLTVCVSVSRSRRVSSSIKEKRTNGKQDRTCRVNSQWAPSVAAQDLLPLQRAHTLILLRKINPDNVLKQQHICFAS